jgi:small subunit ribosomal protein S15
MNISGNVFLAALIEFILSEWFVFQHKNITFASQNLKNKMILSAERKKEIFAKHGKSETNTGSTEGQIALFTARINHLSQHLQINKKDNSTELSLIKLVGKRRSLLNYLARTDIYGYRALIKELDIRK